jgi:hypothetical protein
MKHRFLIHWLSHTSLLVDITSIGLPNEIFPPQGKPQTVPTFRFQAWVDAKRYLGELGATAEDVDRAEVDLKRTSIALLTILEVPSWRRK